MFEGESIGSAKVDGRVCEVRHRDGKTFVNVPHDVVRGVPRRIDRTVDGVAEKFPGLRASLVFNRTTGKLAYSLENKTGSPLSHVLLTISTPPAFEPGILRWNRDEVGGGDKWSVAGEVSEKKTGAYWHDGKCYVAAQLDFVLDGERGRLFTE